MEQQQVTLRLYKSRLLRNVHFLLKGGRRQEAAFLLLDLADKAEVDELRKALKMAAHGLNDAGDRHQRRGRPVRSKGLTLDNKDDWLHEWKEDSARRQLYEAIVARCFVDRVPVGPQTLAKIMIWNHYGFDDEPPDMTMDELREWNAKQMVAKPELLREAREGLATWAAEVLEKLGLPNVPRQGFRAVYRRRVAELNGVGEQVLRGVAPKVKT